MGDLLTYGPGIPRYLAMWLPLAPALVVSVVVLRVRRDAIVALFASTMPTFLLHQAPGWSPWVRWALLVAAEAIVVTWLVREVRADRGTGWDRATTERGPAAPPPRAWRRTRVRAAVVGLALAALTLAVRVPLPWLDPGVSYFARATQVAAEQLLEGHNPWTLANPIANYGTYQYPAGTVLAHAPFVAAVPETVAGETHLGVRATIWVVDVAVVVLLFGAGVVSGRRRGGVAAALAYALHPTLVRESGIVSANDLLLAGLAVGAVWSVWRRRPVLGAVLVGLAISVKPAALVLVPFLLGVAGLRVALVAAVPPALLQLPFLLWPTVGPHGIVAMMEPAARSELLVALVGSAWYPVYRVVGTGQRVVAALAVVGVVAAGAAAWWAGRQVRGHRPADPGSLRRLSAAVALPLAVALLAGSVQRHNYQSWALVPMVLAVGLTAGGRRQDGVDRRVGRTAGPADVGP